MPLDTTMTALNAPVPAHLSFPVGFEPTKVSDKKYVVNNATDEYIGIVGKGFRCADHLTFFEGVQRTMCETLDEDDLTGADVRWRSARKNAWAMMDLQLTNVSARIQNEKFSTTIMPRIIALHGIDGSCSNQVFYGKIDAFCTNGMISGSYDTVRRKNTSGFTMDGFIHDLRKHRQDFLREAEVMNQWLNKPMRLQDVNDLILSIVGTERKARKMTDLYFSEAAIRGHNVFALYSAFTNYATDDVRSGFPLRNTGGDTQAESMWKREQEVSKWISNDNFKSLLQAA